MRITGVVKGTEADAVVAANKHMLQIKVLHVLADSVTIEFLCTKPTQTNMRSNFEEWIRDWFNDRQIPALPGTLLLYSYHGDRLLPSEEIKRAWEVTGDDREVTCHTLVIGGVLCRWWGEDKPAGADLIEWLANKP